MNGPSSSKELISSLGGVDVETEFEAPPLKGNRLGWTWKKR